MKIHELCFNTIRRNKHLKKLNNSKKKKERKERYTVNRLFDCPSLNKIKNKTRKSMKPTI